MDRVRTAPVVAFLVGILACGPALAKPASQPAVLELPKGTRVKIGVLSYQGFRLEEFKVILKINESYKSWAAQIPMFQKRTKHLEDLSKNQSQQLWLQGETIRVLEAERRFLTDKWTKENKLRHIAENRPRFGNWLAWGSAAVAAAVAAVLGGILIAERR